MPDESMRTVSQKDAMEAARRAHTAVVNVAKPPERHDGLHADRIPTEDMGEHLSLALGLYGIGVDVHSKFMEVCIIARSGTDYVAHRKTVSVAWGDLLSAADWVRRILLLHALALPPEDGPLELHYTLESTGCYHCPLILAWQGTPSLVNPALASPSRRKTDKLDAQLLAYHALTGLWPRSFVPTTDLQTLRVILGQRKRARMRATASLNRINNVLLRFGHTLASTGSLASPALRPLVEDLANGQYIANHPNICPAGIPALVGDELKALYADYDAATEEHKRLVAAATTHARACTWPTAERQVPGEELLPLLQTIPGFGPIAVLVWLAEIGDPRRFPNAKACSAFCGSDPSLKVSAGHVTSMARRRGNASLHTILNQCSQSVIRRAGEPLGQWGRRLWLSGGRGSYFKAVGAVARRLSVAAFYVHSKAVPFSYDAYRLDAPELPDVPTSEMSLSPRTHKLLDALELRTSTEVAEAYNRDLRSQPGIGARSMKEIQEWMRKNQLKTSPTSSRTALPPSSSPES